MEKDVNDITQKHEQHSHNTGKQQKYQNKTVKQWTKTNIGKKKENNGWDGETPTRGVPGVWWGSWSKHSLFLASHPPSLSNWSQYHPLSVFNSTQRWVIDFAASKPVTILPTAVTPPCNNQADFTQICLILSVQSCQCFCQYVLVLRHQSLNSK